jgi:nucleotide-binding universal stress UspA family protein
MTVVVVGYAPGPIGDAALSRALAETRLRDGRLVVVNSSRGDAAVDNRYLQEDDVRELGRRLDAAGVPWTLHQPVRGRDAAEEVLQAAEESRADLLVIGLRHRSPVGKLIMGSTAQRVLLDARCPVLAVKAG